MKKYTCNKHQNTLFTIPDNIEECILLNSFQEIKSLENHLENYQTCKIEQLENSN
ncbi:MAG: hypothetical protein HOD60_11800 [Candidatus Nitrosopelagicus sp.]|nr:hypothetical protein [Candidatus Nitrosopelagicus sp.]